ncbi:MAG TPA: ABC transporter permease [Vicinamibacterales bacterium]|jgi:predicted permease|nr:ABC transporter permease [Vicinamibacterales bacterium]
MHGFLLDLRRAVRRLTRRPGGALVFVSTLAIGLTAAATATGVVRTLLLRPLPFTTLDRLVLVRDDVPVTGVEQRAPVTLLDLEALRKRGAAFEEVAAFRFRPRAFGTGPDASEVHVAEVSANFWRAINVGASQGRTFRADEEIPGRDGVVVLNEAFWREGLGGQPVLGRSILIDGRRVTVIGITPARYPLAVDLWIPLALSPAEANDRTARNLHVLALMKPRVTIAGAEADARRVAGALAAEHPDSHRGRSLRLLALRAEQYEFTLGLFSMVQLVAIGVLLVAGANAFTIMVVTVLDGRSESAVRAALGASISRVIRPYLLEALLLSTLSGGLAIVSAQWMLPIVRRGVPAGIAKWIAGWESLQMDLPMALTTWGAATLAGAAIGIAAGIRGARGDLAVAIATDGRAVTEIRSRGRGVMVALQAAVSIVLLSAAVLFTGGLADVRATFGAYDPEKVFLARATAPPHRYANAADVVRFFERAAQAASSLPGVRLAGLVRNAPASNVSNPTLGVWPAEEPPAKGTPAPVADVQIVDARGLAALNVAITRGRALRDSDDGGAERVALVSRQLAVRLWRERESVGRLAALEDGSRWRIVGVVEDVLLNWYDGGPRPTIYLPHAQTAVRGMTVVLRTETHPAGLASPLRAALRLVDRDPPPLRSYTLRAEVDDSLAPLVTLSRLLSALAIVALLLATAGIHGVAAAAVAARTREVGIRIILGARPESIVRLVLRIAVRPVALGCLIGVPAAAALARWLGSYTFGLLTLHPEVPLGVGLLLLVAATAGAWTPARRAARVDPIVALRG